MNPLPSPLQKIIIEYCYYPKLYLEELKEKTVNIYNSIYDDDQIDLGYNRIYLGYARIRSIFRLKDKWIIRSHIIMVDTRYNLIKRQYNRDKILNVGISDYYQKGYIYY